jgi:hypothetical protein
MPASKSSELPSSSGSIPTGRTGHIPEFEFEEPHRLRAPIQDNQEDDESDEIIWRELATVFVKKLSGIF